MTDPNPGDGLADGLADELRCAPATAALGVDPVGSAGVYDRFLLVESPLPWPRDVSEIDALAAASGADPRVRVLAIVPGGGGSGDRVVVTDWQRVGANRFEGVDHAVAPDGVEALLADLLARPSRPHPSAIAAAPPELLVCGHGRRDRCCGRWGTLLQTELAAVLPTRPPSANGALAAPDERAAPAEGVRVRRCGHTGGHRFAPTAISLPDGRAWAFLDVEVAEGIVGRTADPAALRRHYRGSSALDRWGQAVEREVFEAMGWAWLHHDLTEARSEVAPDGRSASVRLAWDGPGGPGAVTAEVAVVRDVPVLVCGEPPEVATTSSAELAARSLVWSTPARG